MAGEKEPVVERTLSENIGSVAAGILGFGEVDFLVSEQQWEALEALCKTADPLIRKARKGVIGRRIGQKLAFVCEEFSMMALTRAFSHPEEANGWLVVAGVGVWAASGVVDMHLANNQQRLDRQALTGVFADMEASPELTGDKDWWRVFESVYKPQILEMANANRAFNNRPGESIAWMTMEMLNLTQMFPDLLPTIAAAWGMGTAQILGSTRMFKWAEGRFLKAASEMADSLSRHGDMAGGEEEKADKAREIAVATTDIINLVTRATPFLPALQALVTQRYAEVPAALWSLLSGSQMAGQALRSKLGASIGAYLSLTGAKQGKEYLNEAIEHWQEAKIRISTDPDWLEHRQNVGSRPRGWELPISEKGKQLAFLDFQAKKLDGSTVGNRVSGVIPADRVIVVRGSSGAGKSSLVESLMQRVKGTSGWVGLTEKGFMTWITDLPDIRQRDQMVMYMNPGKEMGACFMDRVSLDQQKEWIADNEIDDMFIRSSWEAKQGMSEGNEKYTQACNRLRDEANNYLKNQARLFTDGELDEDLLGRNFGQYSEGQKRRLALALVGLSPQQLIALDEPTAQLDVEGLLVTSKDRVIRYINWLTQEKNKTVICIIHDEESNIRRDFGRNLGVIVDVDENGWKVGWQRQNNEAGPKTISDYEKIWSSLETFLDVSGGSLGWYKGDEYIAKYGFRSRSAKTRLAVSENHSALMESVRQLSSEEVQASRMLNEDNRYVNRQRVLASAILSDFEMEVHGKYPDIARCLENAVSALEMSQIIPAIQKDMLISDKVKITELNFIWLEAAKMMLDVLSDKKLDNDQTKAVRGMRKQRNELAKSRIFLHDTGNAAASFIEECEKVALKWGVDVATVTRITDGFTSSGFEDINTEGDTDKLRSEIIARYEKAWLEGDTNLDQLQYVINMMEGKGMTWKEALDLWFTERGLGIENGARMSKVYHSWHPEGILRSKRRYLEPRKESVWYGMEINPALVWALNGSV